MKLELYKDVAAENDLIEIWIYTCEQWSIQQADHYVDLLESGIQILAGNPEVGESRDELMESYWSLRVQHHVVFYTFTESEIRVRRVLHEVMDHERHL